MLTTYKQIAGLRLQESWADLILIPLLQHTEKKCDLGPWPVSMLGPHYLVVEEVYRASLKTLLTDLYGQPQYYQTCLILSINTFDIILFYASSVGPYVYI